MIVLNSRNGIIFHPQVIRIMIRSPPLVYFVLTVISSFLCRQPGNYQSTVKRTEDTFQACNDLVACFQERARLERQYAQQLSEWSHKWKPVVDSSKYSCGSNS